MENNTYLWNRIVEIDPSAKRKPELPSDSFCSGLLNKLVMKKEIWKDIPGYKGIYQVSNYGRILALKRIRKGYSYMAKKWVDRYYKEKIIKPSIFRDYFGVALMKDGKYKRSVVHRLVALAFIPNPLNKPYINHIDFNIHNNHMGNLEWCTAYENIHHTMKHNRDNAPKGEDNGLSKFRNDEVKRIRKLYKLRLANTCQIAEAFGVNQSTINRIINHKTYKYCD